MRTEGIIIYVILILALSLSCLCETIEQWLPSYEVNEIWVFFLSVLWGALCIGAAWPVAIPILLILTVVEGTTGVLLSCPVREAVLVLFTAALNLWPLGLAAVWPKVIRSKNYREATICWVTWALVSGFVLWIFSHY